jgi:hypothetical protein
LLSTECFKSKNNSLLLPLEKNVLPLRGTSPISHAPPFPF